MWLSASTPSYGTAIRWVPNLITITVTSHQLGVLTAPHDTAPGDPRRRRALPPGPVIHNRRARPVQLQGTDRRGLQEGLSLPILIHPVSCYLLPPCLHGPLTSTGSIRTRRSGSPYRETGSSSSPGGGWSRSSGSGRTQSSRCTSLSERCAACVRRSRPTGRTLTVVRAALAVSTGPAHPRAPARGGPAPLSDPEGAAHAAQAPRYCAGCRRRGGGCPPAESRHNQRQWCARWAFGLLLHFTLARTRAVIVVDGLTRVHHRMDERAGLPHHAANRRPREQPGFRRAAIVYVRTLLQHCLLRPLIWLTSLTLARNTTA